MHEHSTEPGLRARHRPIREHRCVRCGMRPPAHELFVCNGCAIDPDMLRERLWVEEHLTDSDEQRRALVAEFGWAGDWWKR